MASRSSARAKKAAPVLQADHRQDCNAAAYARTALESECDSVATAKPGQRNETLNCASFNLGQLVAAGVLAEGEVRDRLYSAAVACGLHFYQRRAIPRSRLRPDHNGTRRTTR